LELLEQETVPLANAGPVGNANATTAAPMPAERLAQLMNEANAHEQAGRLDSAESVLGEILCEMPEHPAALHFSGIVAFKKGRITEAATLMERSIAQLPGDAIYHRDICEVYRVLGRYDESVAAGRRAICLSPKTPTATIILASVITINWNWTRRSRALRGRSNGTLISPVRISAWPKPCCCAATLYPAGKNMNGASSSPTPQN
jgi:predicted Zn-dependent protease